MKRIHIERFIRDGMPTPIRAAVIELLEHVVDDDSGYLLIAGASLLVEPFAFPKPAIKMPPQSGPQPHPLEVVSFVRRHGGNLTIDRAHVPAQNAIDNWHACPAASMSRPEFRHAIRSLHVHLAMSDARRRVGLSETRLLRTICVASTACLLNPED